MLDPDPDSNPDPEPDSETEPECSTYHFRSAKAKSCGSSSTTLLFECFPAVLRIQDAYPGSRIRIFSIPDPPQRI